MKDLQLITAAWETIAVALSIVYYLTAVRATRTQVVAAALGAIGALCWMSTGPAAALAIHTGLERGLAVGAGLVITALSCGFVALFLRRLAGRPTTGQPDQSVPADVTVSLRVLAA